MGLWTLPFRLPFLPAQGVVKLAEIIRDEVDRQHFDTSAVQRDVEEAAQAAASGEISAEEASRRQEEAVGRLLQPQTPAAGTAPGAGEARPPEAEEE
jgi:hypothetical protein